MAWKGAVLVVKKYKMMLRMKNISGSESHDD